jgi:peroxiredoxin Q/BCP
MNKPTPLQSGSPAPAFSTTDQNDKTHTNQTLLGTRYLLYFYPRDLTPGCTTEACALRDTHQQFTKLNTLVFGISPDDEKSHRKFIDKNNLPFSLLVDKDHAIAEAFGVWGEKKFMGRTFDGVHRMSFLIDTDGEIEKTYARVKLAEHAEQVLSDLQG